MVVNSEAPKSEHNNEVNQADVTACAAPRVLIFTSHTFIAYTAIDMIFMHQIDCTYCTIKSHLHD
jgi:hypothetical protein